MRFSRWDVIFGLVTSMGMFATLNYREIRRLLGPTFCDDCDLPYGLPFTFFRDGGFLHDTRIVWLGLIGDGVIVVGGGAVIAWLLNRIIKHVHPIG
ncbi:MAG: hypothetical protein ABSE57_24685 [Bryobacteraceae bacterium]|jgi:hypothetical protein